MPPSGFTPISWPTGIWAMVAAACLTMALPHLILGLSRRGARVHLIFALAAGAVAWVAAAELLIMRSVTTEECGRAIQWGQVPVAIVAIAIVGFVYLYFGTGRLWIGVLGGGLRLVCLVINFAVPPNLNFLEITALRRFEFLGEIVSMPVGPRNPWTTLAYISSLLVLLFVVDASWQLWRRGGREQRRRAVVVGGSIAFFIIAAQGVAVLVNAGVIQAPFFISIPFTAIIVAMGLELGYDLVRTAQLSRALRESEERMSLAAESARLAMWEWDIARDEVWMTDQGRALLGIAPGSPLNYTALVPGVHVEDRAAREAAIQRAIETRGSYATEYRLLLPDGSTRWIAARGKCVDGGDHGATTRLLGISMDITSQKQADAEARLRHEELAHLGRVAVIGEMGTSLAHEINQPLAAIANNASAGRRFIAHGHGELPRLQSLFEAIVADTRRAGEIIRGIRGMVRPSASARATLDLNDVVASAFPLVRGEVQARQCLLTSEPGAGLPLVEANVVQLQQVLLNLVVNACDAMCDIPVEQRRVTVRTDSPAPDRARISVCDAGPGLPGDSARIFAPFYSTKADGLGMGLAIARSIARAHGGELDAENLSDGGACFHLWLPMLSSSRP